MIRPLAAIAVAAVMGALAYAAAALALATGDYFGDIRGDASSGITFDVRQTQDGRKVKRITATGLDFTCPEGKPGDTSGVALERTFKVEQGEFGGRSDAVILGFDPPARITGKLRRGGTAAGTIRMHGELDPKGQPGVKCRTGPLEWRAKKAPPS